MWGSAQPIYIANQLPSPVLNNVSPVSLWSNTILLISMGIWVSLFWHLLPSNEKNKLPPQATKLIFLGYCDHKGFLYYEPSTTVFVPLKMSSLWSMFHLIPFSKPRARHKPPIFLLFHPLHPPQSFPITQVYAWRPKPPPTTAPALDHSPLSDPLVPSNVSLVPQPLRCSTRVSKPPKNWYGFHVLFITLDSVSNPPSYSQAIKEPWW